MVFPDHSLRLLTSPVFSHTIPLRRPRARPTAGPYGPIVLDTNPIEVADPELNQ
jgi:hypothetical protein